MNDPKKFSHDIFLTAEQIYKKLRISKTTFYKGLKDGVFPPPYKFGTRCNRWPQSVWDDYLKGKGGHQATDH